MKNILVFLSLFIVWSINGQNTGGIVFETNLNWNGVIKKAKENNKFIFVDAYTTWCLPCTFMKKKIFTQRDVGDFFNNNFINIAVQIDTQKNDNDQIKKWYKDAEMIAKNYQIEVYPTYLFLDPNGNLVHTITGASETATDFMAKSKKALNPETQYSFLKSQFTFGNRDSVFLLSLINAAIEASDDSLTHVFINSYLKTQANLLSPANINLISKGTITSKDTGFTVLLTHPEEVNKIIGENQRINILDIIAFDEDIFPVIMPNGKKTSYGGGLSIYGGGQMNQNVNWPIIEEKIISRYGNLSGEIILKGKLKYYLWSADWEMFNNLLFDYISSSKKINPYLVNYMAGKLMNESDEKESFKDAIKWAHTLKDFKEEAYFLETYSRLLYKAGEKQKAILFMEKYSSLSPDNSTKETIEKMRNNQSIE